MFSTRVVSGETTPLIAQPVHRETLPRREEELHDRLGGDFPHPFSLWSNLAHGKEKSLQVRRRSPTIKRSHPARSPWDRVNVAFLRIDGGVYQCWAESAIILILFPEVELREKDVILYARGVSLFRKTRSLFLCSAADVAGHEPCLPSADLAG